MVDRKLNLQDKHERNICLNKINKLLIKCVKLLIRARRCVKIPTIVLDLERSQKILE